MASPDIIVVGAGPAGAWTARCLARAGARVRIFDPSHPREKPCGGGVTGRALSLVGDAIDLASLRAVEIERGVFEDPRTAPANVPLRERCHHDARLAIVDRTRFDRALLDAACAAGAEHVNERVLDVGVADGRARVRTASGRHEASWVIGADGANSLVRRRLHRPFRRDQLSIATGVFAHGVSDTTIVVRFVPSPQGYIWSFPRHDHLAVGICAQADETSATALRQVMNGWLETSRLTAGRRLEPYSWPIPSLAARDFETERPAGDQYLLVGDAAGLVDPITREGIYFALLSAAYAAEAILRDGRHAATPATYERALRRAIYPELSRAARLKRGFFRGSFTRLMVDALNRSARVRAVMVDLVAGVQPYRTLERRLVRTLEVKLAWELWRLRGRRSRFELAPSHQDGAPSP